MDLLQAPLASAEFLVVDTETNGLGGDACELTEVGSVLVGGGELHDRWSSLVRTVVPLRRGIQRFTGITDAMSRQAPEPEAVLPLFDAQLRGRVLVAHNAPFDRRVLRQAYARAGIDWPNPPVICTAGLSRALMPLQNERRLGALADALGIEVAVAHRALPDAETCARVLCALFPKLCANAGTVADALALLKPRRASRARRARTASLSRAAGRASGRGHDADLPLPDFSELPRDPGVYIFRDTSGTPLYVGKSISIRSRARAHFAPSTGSGEWTAHAAVVDYRTAQSELGALVLENRLIKELKPPGNNRLNTRPDERLVYVRCRLDIPFPILEVAREPAAGHAVTIGPLRGRHAALELVEQLDSLFGLRHCGRRLRLREHPSAYGQMGRCLSPCLGDLDPNLYRRRLEQALRLFDGSGDGRSRLLGHVEAQMREAAAQLRFERAEWLRRRMRRLTVVLDRLGGVLEATHAKPRLLLAPHPANQRPDAFWIAGGRLVDWGALPAVDELVDRTERALRAGGRPGEFGAHLPPDQVEEMRIVDSWVVSHPDVPQLVLDPPPDPDELSTFAAQPAAAAQTNGSETTSAEVSPGRTETTDPGGASRLTSASAIAPNRGESATVPSTPTALSSNHS
jgi:DNA polymerase-3 subunit epsilon